MKPISLIISINGRNVNRMLINSKKVTLGRDTRNDVVLDDPAVSSKHAHIEWAEHRYRLVDLSSTNGTFVNNERIDVISLDVGDIISVGMTNLEIADPKADLESTKEIKKSWLPGVYYLKDKISKDNEIE